MAHLRYERNLAKQRSPVAPKPIDDAEPYMIMGYTAVPAEDASTGAQSTSKGLWEAPRQEQSMEDQYGAFLAARDFERFQELHTQVEAAKMMSAGSATLDDEMMV